MYLNTNDIERLYQQAVDLGYTTVSPPTRLERWPVSTALIRDPDGYLVELLQQHPWTDDDGEFTTWLGQCCINVSDLEASVAFWETLGLSVLHRTEIPEAYEAILGSPGHQQQLHLAQQKAQEGSIEMGTAMWKLYLLTDQCQAAYDAALAAGYASLMVPAPLDRWPVIVGFVEAPDGYQVELLEHLGT